jgi:TatD DNase family protein
MSYIDTHTHLYLKEFENDRETVIQNALNEGVEKMLLPNIDRSSVSGIQAMVLAYPGICYPMIGLHPTSVSSDYSEILNEFEYLLQKNKYIGIGETGIDLYWDKTFKSQQTEAFKIQTDWAKKYKLPLVIHARESLQEIFTVLDELWDENLRGVFHSFSGTKEDASHVMEYGFFVGINGIITFKNSGLEIVVKDIPPDRILLETDSPFLSPVPKRGRRNESGNIKYIAERLSEIYSLPLKEFAAITSRNASRLFEI